MFGVLVIFSAIVNLVVCDPDYLVNSEKCKMPNFPAFSEEINMTFIAEKYIPCTVKALLSYTTVEKNTAYLHIRQTAISSYYDFEDQLNCCYSYITRNGTEDEPDLGISISPCQKINTTVSLEQETVAIKCINSTNDTVYENVHNPITISDNVRDKLEIFKNEERTPISVLFIVIDSVGRLNLERTMPITRDFLLNNEFTEFIGYNKIDDNTFPNFGALLSGLNLRQLKLMCKPTKVGKLDACPMIWTDFRNLGYATAYAEDWASLNTFNYQKKGFKDPPTDYYYKPYFEATEFLQVSYHDTMPYCTGPETQGERTLNLAKDFATTFKNHPSFGIFWMNTFSHNYLNSPSIMDEKFKEFFADLEANGIFNESVVIFLADHGMRFGDVRETVQGWYEERLPMNYISIPPWFRAKFPTKYENFNNNAKKLTSTYDLYLTLEEILQLSVPSYKPSSSLACPTCASLFSEIPESRSCKLAGIPEVWCTCFGKLEKNSSLITEDLTNEAIKLALEMVQMEKWQSPNVTIQSIISTSISVNPESKSYFLMVFRTNTLASYQSLFRLKSDPVEILSLIQLTKLVRFL